MLRFVFSRVRFAFMLFHENSDELVGLERTLYVIFKHGFTKFNHIQEEMARLLVLERLKTNSNYNC